MALAPFSRKLTLEDAAHLLRRTSFGGTDAQIRALVGEDARQAAKKLLSFDQTRAPGNPFDPSQAVTPSAGIELTRAGWLFEMLYGPHPLREKLALTWSNHFVIGTDKVRNMPALTQYLNLLRANAAPISFSAFALAVAQSPAMLNYLDNDQNKKGKPNENFSRELLELFTTGIGHYTEDDVREGARALTGWTYEGGRGDDNFLQTPRFIFRQEQYDAGKKTYLGQTGHLNGEDVVRLATTHPQAAVFVARKLHRAFVADTPDEKAVAGSAETFRRTNGNVHAVLEELLSSETFYSIRGSIIRSPMDFIVAAIRALGGPALEAKQIIGLTWTAGKMGQLLLQADTVKGWEGGREWVSDSTLLVRMQLAAAFVLSKTAPKPRVIPTSLVLLGSERTLLRAALDGLDDKQRTYLTLISPEFQLV